VAIATATIAITFALQPGIGAPHSNAAETGLKISPFVDIGRPDKSDRRTMRRISINRIEKIELHTLGTSVAPTDNDDICSVSQPREADVVPETLTVLPRIRPRWHHAKATTASRRVPGPARKRLHRRWQGFDAVH
jgi:hypothetical protein